ncbi:MAG: DUF2249 domain-containing protein [Magnetococcales bacterium]|nr:DUF2249 domain-containing protein [Magnetococcales bacterium]
MVESCSVKDAQGAGGDVVGEVRQVDIPDGELDVRHLPAPEPLMRMLQASAALPPGGVITAHHRMFPCFLEARLAERGMVMTVDQRADDWFVIEMQRPAHETDGV